MKGDRENLKSMVSRVQHWLVCKRWKKVIYGAISVQKCELVGYITKTFHVLCVVMLTFSSEQKNQVSC